MTSFRQKLITFLQGTNPTERQAFLAHLTASELTHLIYDWQIWARAKQLPPEGDWVIWLIMAGRGFGKTRAGAEWIRSAAMAGTSALIILGVAMPELPRVDFNDLWTLLFALLGLSGLRSIDKRR